MIDTEKEITQFRNEYIAFAKKRDEKITQIKVDAFKQVYGGIR